MKLDLSSAIEVPLAVRTLRLKVKSESYPWLNAAAAEVNQVWNYSNEVSAKAARPFAGRGRLLSGYDLDKLTAGACEWPNRRLRYTDTFEDPNLPGEILVTVTLQPVSVGTEINILQEGIPDVIPVEACYLGWQESLRNLARLVEPEITQ